MHYIVINRLFRFISIACCMALTALLLACAEKPVNAQSAAATAALPQRSPTPVPTPAPTPTATPVPTPFCMLWLSDTQCMAYSAPGGLQKMGDWVAKNRVRRNIIQAVHTGDAVEHGANAVQWEAVDACLHAFEHRIPYFAIAGNHELGVREKDYRWFLSRRYIRALPQAQRFDGGKAAYTTFHAGGRDFLILGAGWEAELAATDWMNNVLDAHPDHIAVLLFHGFLDRQGKLTRIGRQLYPAVVAKNPNVRLVLCGHIPGNFSRTDELDDDGDGVADRKVHLMLYNYQHYADRYGQLRLLTFDPLAGSMEVETYSPVTDSQFRTSPYGQAVYTVEALF